MNDKARMTGRTDWRRKERKNDGKEEGEMLHTEGHCLRQKWTLGTEKNKKGILYQVHAYKDC